MLDVPNVSMSIYIYKYGNLYMDSCSKVNSYIHSLTHSVTHCSNILGNSRRLTEYDTLYSLRFYTESIQMLSHILHTSSQQK